MIAWATTLRKLAQCDSRTDSCTEIICLVKEAAGLLFKPLMLPAVEKWSLTISIKLTGSR